MAARSSLLLDSVRAISVGNAQGGGALIVVVTQTTYQLRCYMKSSSQRSAQEMLC